ncbi:hypothetical protein [Nostoc sp. FACHB-280]|uniref:hypothetical protein n=1 Tax=Nostoc sp. FACHB-280 TaxID=2692839 RepID=UPI00168B739E|nr:hypothetical protein [Nostoc sp. FACHB-280]MBD2494564.1 hypothetical protein [Nostoc sp. FACHB-280]
MKFLKSIWTLCLILALFKLWLTSHLPIIASYGGHDNLRYIQQAWEIFNFKPPFHYDQYVLMRQPGYPFLIRLSHILGFSLRFSQELLYISSGFFLAWSFYRYYKNKLIVFIFLTLHILLPASFFLNRETLQESLYLPLTIFIISCLIHLLNQPFTSKNFIFWSGCLGLGLAWFYNTRPEGILIIPSVGVMCIPLFIKALRFEFNKRNVFRYLQISLLSICLPVIFITSSICLTNYFKFGLFAVDDLTSPGIKAAYAQLTSVKHEKWRRFVPVPEETRLKIYDASPSFKKLSVYLEQQGKVWMVPGCRTLNICDDYPGGWFLWAFRDAVAYAGQYKSAPETELFYKQMAFEIKSACLSEKLSCSNNYLALPTLSIEGRDEYIKPFLKSFSKITQKLVNEILILNLTNGEENLAHRKKFYEKVTREPFDFIKYRNTAFNQLKDKFIYWIAEVYKFCFPVILVTSLISLLLAHTNGITSKKVSLRIPLIIVITMLLTMIMRITLIAYIDTTSFPGGFRYVWNIVPLLLMNIAIGMSYFYEIFSIKKILIKFNQIRFLF